MPHEEECPMMFGLPQVFKTQQAAIEAVVFEGWRCSTLPAVYGGKRSVVLSEDYYAELLQKAYGPQAYVKGA